MKCADFESVVCLADGRLSPQHAAEIRQHVANCARCKATHELVLGIMDGFAEGPSEFDVPNLAESILLRTRLQDVRPEERQRLGWLTGRWRLALAPAAFGAVSAIVLAIVGPFGELDEDSGYRVRGSVENPDRWVSMRVVREIDNRYQRVGKSIAANDKLAFTYANRGEKPYRYLMVFALNEGGDVYWYYPAYEDPYSDPQSIEIGSTQRQEGLPDKIQHDLKPGQLRLFAVFSHRPWHVSAVEELVGHEIAIVGDLRQYQRVGLAATGQDTQLVDVQPQAARQPLR